MESKSGMLYDKESEKDLGVGIEGTVVFKWTEEKLEEFQRENKQVMDKLHNAMVDGSCCSMAYLPK